MKLSQKIIWQETRARFKVEKKDEKQEVFIKDSSSTFQQLSRTSWTIFPEQDWLGRKQRQVIEMICSVDLE